jgi:hypothetical protein
VNTRERFLALMRFESVPTFRWEFGYWASTAQRWYDEGLPRRVGVPAGLSGGDGIRGEATGWYHPSREFYDLDIHEHVGMDNAIRRVTINNWLQPAFETVVLEDHDTWQLIRDNNGVTKRMPKGHDSLPDFEGFPVQTMYDWERIKAERLQITFADRVPAVWNDLLAEYRGRDYPLAIGGSQGFFGTPRNLLGPENLLLAYYDQPELVHTIINDLTDFWIAVYDQLLNLVPCDLGLIWEDMSYKAGSLISPATFREFMMPAYKRLTGFWRDHGIRNVWVDTDGECSGLIPLMMEGGVTGIYPMEVRAGMNVVEVRKAYPTLQIMGGIDKTAIAAGRDAIDEELESKVPAMLRAGGYIPYIDHYVPPEISFPDFVYYRQRLAEMIGGR